MEEYSVEYYRKINEQEREQAQALAQGIIDLYHPRSVVDLGCGTGLYLAPFDCPIIGYDISPAAFDEQVRQVDPNFLAALDLRERHTNYLVSDVALCLEVVEHIGSEYAETVVDNICQYANTIIMTAAPPGQAGLNHVNCQPMRYWEEKFTARGFRRDYHDEYELAYRVWLVPHTLWLVRNLAVFKCHE